MSEYPKTVVLRVTAHFEGDYWDGQEAEVMEEWIDGAFEDCDDLRGWKVEVSDG